MDMNFCRRCGSPLLLEAPYTFVCKNKHRIFENSVPASVALLFNQDKQLLITTREVDPGKGLLDVPGGFCDGPEPFEVALTRELKEEVGLRLQDYSRLTYLLSGEDDYLYKSESIRVLVAVFVATLAETARPQPKDGIAAIDWYTLDQVPIDKLFAPVVVTAIKRLKTSAN